MAKTIEVGKYNNLKVLKKTIHGYYLEGDDYFADILLPNKYAPKNIKINSTVKVFIYFDSEDLIIATTKKPYAIVGEFASLKVASVEEIGVFLDWGLEKDLFVPLREKLFDMLPGHNYVVYLYVDSSGRIAASTRIDKFTVNKTPIPFGEHQEVELLPYHESDMGISALINNTPYTGLIYKNEIFKNVKLGQKITGYIKKVRKDTKIDLKLQRDGLGGRKDLSDEILKTLQDSGGSLNITAKTPANEVSKMFNVSRKKFKIALGNLYKKELISISENSISLRTKK